MRKSIFAGAALVATAFGGSIALGGVTALPAGASTGCGVTVHVHNQTKSSLTVQWDQSDSRAWFVFAGPWAKLGSGSTTIAAGQSGSKAFTLTFSCSTDHQYRVHYTQGSNSAYRYFPANTNNWTTSNSPNVYVK
jgi:hypothetical protein